MVCYGKQSEQASQEPSHGVWPFQTRGSRTPYRTLMTESGAGLPNSAASQLGLVESTPSEGHDNLLRLKDAYSVQLRTYHSPASVASHPSSVERLETSQCTV
ncbi:unnamed protein product [Clonostachys rhizophaga]|uniref:Uncharacterized protein n=1 Tax=Clonostachys rhizophaga TaxID=160324 RepID=A0A9N9V6X3_9HYPO|nr:unnamed protein product [Clonostachys rhizophaga]